MHSLDLRIVEKLMGATAPMTGQAIADAIGAGTTAVAVRRRIGCIRREGIGVVCWLGPFGGYILTTREDILYPHSVGSVIAECEAIAARRELH